ncbi:SPFH domain-containing protein [Wenjunlia tyrosinilytica]|nr:SPFH domain-containing protein [Wenjunlia tyrosinilytica]
MAGYVLIGILGALAGWMLLGGVRVVNQIERGVVFRFGRARPTPREPGLTLLVPLVDRLKKVNVQIVTMPVPTQEGITRDNVSVQVDAVVYFRVVDPLKAAIEVQNYVFAVEQVAQTSLRSIIGKSELDDLLSNREELHKGLELMIDSPAVGWGIEIERVEIKDVQLPDSMKRSMSRQAEAERERRARVITADGEFQAAAKLADASAIMADTPGALQLRLLQTVVEVAAEKNSTLVMPFPVELLRFFERAGGNDSAAAAAPTRGKAVEQAEPAVTPEAAVVDQAEPAVAPEAAVTALEAVVEPPVAAGKPETVDGAEIPGIAQN